MAATTPPPPPSSTPHWKYFKTLCEDVERLNRFIELVPENYGTHSIEIVRLFLATCSEIDVVLKLTCETLEPKKKAKNIKAYAEVLLSRFPHLPETVVSSKFAYREAPWREWLVDKSPPWWSAYNEVKHERNRFFAQASVGNLLNALAGLCVAINYYQQMALRESHANYYAGLMKIEDPSPFYTLNSLHGTSVQPRLQEATFIAHSFMQQR